MFDIRKEVFDNLVIIKKHLTDCAEIDSRIDVLLKTMEDVSELTGKLINQNSRAAQDQEEYQKRYNSYREQFDRAKAEYDELKQQKEERKNKIRDLDIFVAEFKKAKCRISDFDERLWQTVLDKAIIMPNGTISFKFTNGSIIEK